MARARTAQIRGALRGGPRWRWADPARGAPRRAGAAAAPLAAGLQRGRAGRVAGWGARHRQVALAPSAAGADRGRALQYLAVPVLGLSSQLRALPLHRAARIRGGLQARGYPTAEAGQDGNDAGG